MCREQVVPSTMEPTQVNAHLQEIKRMQTRHEQQNRMQQAQNERQDTINRLSQQATDENDRGRIIEVLASDNKVTKGKQTKKE